MRQAHRIQIICFLAVLLMLAGCGSMNTAAKDEKPFVTMPTEGEELVQRYAPAFLISNPDEAFNRIGQPRARVYRNRFDLEVEEIYVSPAASKIYYETRRFWTKKGWYQNLIYRVHFMGSPLSLIPFNLGAGCSNGVMVVVTLDRFDLPVLITTVGTCGCYVSFTATNYTPEDMMPGDWMQEKPEDYFGEKVPAKLSYEGFVIPRLLVSLGSGEHRVQNLQVLDGAKFQGAGEYQVSRADLTPMEELKRLPLGDGRTTSMYSGDLLSIGHVKGAFKPLEFFTLGLYAMDPLVGQDKEYGNIRNAFYTSLRPWNRMASDMNEYPRFLRFHGWKP